MQLRPVDAAALAHLNRALIGFDRIFQNIESRSVGNNYPPHNVIKHTDNDYEIEVAVAGFEKSEISVTVDQDELVISGKKLGTDENTDSLYIYRGLAARDFDRSFTLPQYMEVSEVTLTNGVLSVKLSMKVPEALKPRQIEIK
jgi:molecular chaperone IbpA